MFMLDLEKAEEAVIKLPTSIGLSKKKKENSRKTSISALLTMPKPLTGWITINCGKINGLDIPIKKKMLSHCIKETRHNSVISRETYFKYKVIG